MRLLCIYDTMDLPETLLAKAMAERGASVDVLCNQSRGYYRMLEGHCASLSPFVCKSALDWGAARKLRTILLENRYDVIHAFTKKSLSVALLASRGMKVKIAGYRGALGNVSRFSLPSWLSYLHPRVSAILCVSNAVKEDLVRRGVPEKKAIRIYKGHDPAWYAEPPEVTRSALGVPESAFLIICVANMRKNKGVDVLLQAALLLPDHPNIHFLVVGEVRGRAVTSLAARAEIAARVHLTGFRSDASLLIKLADVYVLPTRYREGLPKSVLEAMAQEVPVVATRVGGVPEIITDGESGLLIPPGDPRAITAAILRLYGDSALRELIKQGARARIEASFSFERTCDEVLRFYENLVTAAD